MAILNEGYEIVIRSRLGVDEMDLPDAEIYASKFPILAEGIVKNRVPDYADIIDETDAIFIEDAVICYVCYLLCPSMPRRLNIEVKTLDTAWKKDKTNWEEEAENFLAKYEEYLSNLSTVSVVSYSVSIVGRIDNEYLPIGS